MSTQISTDAVTRHNAYGWIRPDADACYVCGRKAFATPVDGFVVSDCDKCGQPICQECAEVDYDSSSEGYRCTQWQCEAGCKESA
jgi:hypothetical protein